MPNSIEIYMRDYDGTLASTEISVLVSSTAIELQALKDALMLWSAGASDGFYFSQEVEAPTGDIPFDPDASAFLEAVIVIDDLVADKRYHLFLPMPDMNKAPNASPPFHEAWINVGNNEAQVAKLNESHVDWPTLRDALQAIWVSKDGNTGTVLEVNVIKRTDEIRNTEWIGTYINYQLP